MAPLSGNSRPDRIPPQSEDAERGVLGSILIDAERIADLCTVRGITAASFYFPTHRMLYEQLMEMRAKMQVIDLLTVTERLRSHNQLEPLGGVAFLQELIDFTPTSAHAEHYIDLVYEKFLLRMVIDKSREAVENCYDPDKDAKTVLAQTESEFFAIGQTQKSGAHKWSDLMDEAVHEINKIFDEKKDLTGVPSGFVDIDKQLRGMQPSDMIVLAARPSMGKTSLALNIAENVAMGKGDPHRTRRGVAVFSLEMSADQLVRRMVCSHARVPFHKVGGGYLSNELHQFLLNAADALKDAPIHIDDTAGLDVMDLRSRARRLKSRYPDIELIVIDYLQLMNCDKFARDGRQRETAAISNEVKAMAKELKVPVLILSQLSRAAEIRDKTARPKLSDLRDSGSIEQDADVVMLLRRPCKYPDDPEHDDLQLSILDVAKHRNGPTGHLRLNFIDQYTRFEDRQDGVDPDQYAD